MYVYVHKITQAPNDIVTKYAKLELDITNKKRICI